MDDGHFSARPWRCRPPLMLLLEETKLEERRRAARGSLAPLLASLSADLDPVIDRRLFIPPTKALLSRAGGRCERDGSNLDFDPFSPKAHRCPSCSAVYEGELHERAWNTWYHLWLAERALQAALFHHLVGNGRQATFARATLRAYADVYLGYPNRDNVLGPTRPFFSTYLESIWLLQLCLAADLVEREGDRKTADIVRERIVEPSSALIAGFDEGNSNRQVWNNAALLASALLLGDRPRAETVVHARSGVATHLESALLPDGTWFEGDNYHQFAIRGLWYAVTMCQANGIELSVEHTRSFDRGVRATFATALPDFTFPSRKDSQYAVSLRQWRFAELAELGFGRTADEQLGSALARCYERGHERRDTGRSRSTADAERNVAASALSRADLGWRALLHALPELPDLRVAEPQSEHLAGQGLAIFRRNGDVFVALDYGQSGAGHGHPDRLNLLLSQGSTRWLDDLGTGSYVDKSLHWYRSSLAHNAPFVDGRSQQPDYGTLVAHDEQGEYGWVEALFIDKDITLTRTLVVAPNYLIDELSWSGAREAQVDLPWHVDGAVDGVALSSAMVDGGTGLEDGFEFATEWTAGVVPQGAPIHLTSTADGRAFGITMVTSAVATLLRAEAPGQPASKSCPFYMVRLRGARGRLRAVVAWDARVRPPQIDGERVRVAVGDRHDSHVRTPTGWRVDIGGPESRVVELAGRTRPASRRAGASGEMHTVPVRRGDLMDGWWSALSPVQRARSVILELGERNYRGSEESWRDAGSPSATVAIAAADAQLEVFIHVRAQGQRFSFASARNRLDNEHPDTMGAGVQLYVRGSRGRGMWSLVPEAGGDRVRIREIQGSATLEPPTARWRPSDDGYEVYVRIPHRDPRVDIDVVINEAVAGRERRRGQLVTADVQGEFVYLRGDREDESRSIHLNLTA